MNTLNRVLLTIIFALVAVASLIGVLIALGVVTADQINSIIPFRQVTGFFRANFVAASLISILLLAVVLVLAIYWLRGQFAQAVTAATGGLYEVEPRGPGQTAVDYDVVETGIDNLIMGIPGVVSSQTRIYAEREGRLFANSSLLVKRGADIHGIDNRIRDSINRQWLDKLGSRIDSHDITINLEPTERRVA